MDDKKKEELQKDFDEAYRLAMEMVIEKRGGDRSIVYQKLMENAPNIGMIVVEREAVYEGAPGTLVWDYGLCNEITFIYEDDPEHIAVLYTAKNEYDAERAFNEYYNKMRPEGAPEEEIYPLTGGKSGFGDELGGLDFGSIGGTGDFGGGSFGGFGL